MLKLNTIDRLKQAILSIYQAKLCSGMKNFYFKDGADKSISLNQKELAAKIGMAVETVRAGLIILEADNVIRVGNHIRRKECIIHITDTEYNKILNEL